MNTDLLTQTMTLSDGRDLGYAQSGDANGIPLFLLHGLNSSRLEVCIAEDAMLKFGIRCIGIDRPGIGLSSFQKDRTVLGFVDDIEALAEHLNIEKFLLIGVSAGTPYALACSYKIPHKIIACGIISGVAPVFTFGLKGMSKGSRDFIILSKKIPFIIKYIFWFLHGRLSKNSEKEDLFLQSIMFSLDDVDKKLIESSSAKKLLLKTCREGYKQGSKRVADDGILAFGKPWGFKLEEIDFTPIYLWHGEKDKGIPLAMAKHMSENLEGSILKTYPKEGHLSIIFNQIDDILNDFVSKHKK